jgi:hypothetical protein
MEALEAINVIVEKLQYNCNGRIGPGPVKRCTARASAGLVMHIIII